MISRQDMQMCSNHDYFTGGALAALWRTNLKLFLVFDQVDAIWMQHTFDNKLQRRAHAFFNHLGNCGWGHVFTIIISSTPFLDRLIDGEHVPGFHQRISLNSTKYPMTRIIGACNPE